MMNSSTGVLLFVEHSLHASKVMLEGKHFNQKHHGTFRRLVAVTSKLWGKLTNTRKGQKLK